MCLAIPGKITAVYEKAGLRLGSVDFGGVAREACLAYVPEAQVGDYVIVHVGFALTRLDEAEAQAALDMVAQLAAMEPEETELGPGSAA